MSTGVVNFQSFLIAIEEIGLQNQAHGVPDVALQGLSGEGTVSQRIAHFLHLQAAGAPSGSSELPQEGIFRSFPL